MRHPLPLAATIAAALMCLTAGCGPLVGVRATVQVSEQTRLEREVLGRRGQLSGQDALLLPADIKGLAPEELRAAEEQTARLQRRLAALPAHEPETRAWQIVTLHNHSVLLSTLGRSEEAGELLQEARRRASAYGFPTLEWQAVQTEAMLTDSTTTFSAAAEMLVAAPLLGEIDYSLESGRRRRLLHGRLVRSSLAREDVEGALHAAARRRALELARSTPPGTLDFGGAETAPAVAELRRARAEAAGLRRRLCRLPMERLTAEAPPRAVASFQDALKGIAAIRESLRGSSAAAGLAVPDPADLVELYEILPPDAALLMFEPLGHGEYAALTLASGGAGARRLGRTEVSETAGQASALLARALASLNEDVRRLYLAPPAEWSALEWQSMAVDGGSLVERFEVAFLGGPADLAWAEKAKSFGRESVFIVGSEPTLGAAASLLEEGTRATAYEATGGKEPLAEKIALADVLWFLTPLRLPPGAPAGGHLIFPGGLGRVGGVSVTDVLGYRLNARCAALARAEGEPFGGRSLPALRVWLRSLIAAGVSSAVVGSADDPLSPYWRRFVPEVRAGAAAAAHRRALAELKPTLRSRHRLYGFAGLSEEEYTEAARLELSDTARNAEEHFAAGRYRQAAAEYLDFWRMVRAVALESERQRTVLLRRVNARLARCFRELLDYRAAIRHQELVIARIRDLADAPAGDLAAARRSLGALLTEARRYEEAAEALEQAAEAFGKAGLKEELGLTCSQLGDSHQQAAHYRQSLEAFGRAFRVYEELGHPAGMAEQQQKMGIVQLNRLSNAPRAAEHFRRARELYEEEGDEAGRIGSVIDLGLCDRSMGDLASGLGKFELALQQSAAEELKAVKARAQSEVANTRWLRGEYQSALALARESNELAREVNDFHRLNANHQLVALVYWELNQFDRAVEALGKAVEAARKARKPSEVATAHNNRGIIERRRGNYREALRWFERAEQTDRRLRDLWALAYDRRNIGITLHRMERLGEALPHLRKAVELAARIDDPVNLAKARLALGELQLDRDLPAEAEPLLQQAAESGHRMHLPEVEWRAHHAVGRMHRKRGDREAALRELKAGVEVVEAMRGRLKVAEFHSSFLSNKTELYEETVQLLLEMDRPAEAFTYSERSRARKFIDLLSGRPVEFGTEVEGERYRRLQELDRRMRSLRQTLGRESEEKSREQLNEELNRLQNEYTRLLTNIRAENPELADLVTVNVADPAEIARALPADTVLLAYYLLPREVVVWALSKDGIAVRRVEADRQELTEAVRELRISIQNRELLAEVQRAAGELHGLLIGPVEDLLGEGRTVGIVPHRGLHYLSFAALYDGEGFLVERHPLFYGPSASVLYRTWSSAPAQSEGEPQVLAVGNPATGNPAYSLPFTEREVISISRDFRNVDVVTGEAASEEWLKSNIGRFDVVHIGAHGRFEPLNPLFSSLMLSPREQDGLLHLHEVTGLRLKARLVTLSACQSGVGELRSGDDLVSLSRAFSYAGTRSILSTLWRVDDVSTALVTKHFYRHYIEHGAAVSLRHAQLQVMNDGRHFHPSYWAGLILSGDWR